jgi:hypothetical protein
MIANIKARSRAMANIMPLTILMCLDAYILEIKLVYIVVQIRLQHASKDDK